MKPKYLLFAAPVILLAEILLFSTITSLLRQQSDVSVFIGVVLLCALIIFNFYLVRFIVSNSKS